MHRNTVRGTGTSAGPLYSVPPTVHAKELVEVKDNGTQRAKAPLLFPATDSANAGTVLEPHFQEEP